MCVCVLKGGVGQGKEAWGEKSRENGGALIAATACYQQTAHAYTHIRSPATESLVRIL